MATANLEARVQKLEDTLEIMNLQARYNFYLQMYWGKRTVEELYAKKTDVCTEINGGRWNGYEGVMRMFSQLDKVNKSQPGRMGLMMAIQPLITLADDGLTANGQWYCAGPCVLPVKHAPDDEEHLESMWQFGRYDNDYVKEDGKWLFTRLCFSLHFLSPIDKGGWHKSPRPYYVRPFEAESSSEPDVPPSFPDLYKPEGPNAYGPTHPFDAE
jgi:hypothetical protein